MSSPLFAQHFLDEGDPNHLHDEHQYGRWIKAGPSVNEFPACYQLWRCDKSHLDESVVIKNRLPQGEWGVCENYLTPSKENPNYCSQCDVAPPKELCY